MPAVNLMAQVASGSGIRVAAVRHWSSTSQSYTPIAMATPTQAGKIMEVAAQGFSTKATHRTTCPQDTPKRLITNTAYWLQAMEARTPLGAGLWMTYNRGLASTVMFLEPNL